MLKILIVEDEMVTAKSLEKSLERFGYNVVGLATHFEEGIEMVINTKPDIILMDIKLKGELDGVTLAQRIQVHTDVPIIYLTAHSDSETVSRALHTSPYGYLVKPCDDEELEKVISDAINRYKGKKGMK